MDIDICNLGNDQRKINAFARDYQKKGKKPVIISNKMLRGLMKGQEKMSKSHPDSALFMDDSRKDVLRKIKNSYCEEKSLEDNATMAFVEEFGF